MRGSCQATPGRRNNDLALQVDWRSCCVAPLPSDKARLRTVAGRRPALFVVRAVTSRPTAIRGGGNSRATYLVVSVSPSLQYPSTHNTTAMSHFLTTASKKIAGWSPLPPLSLSTSAGSGFRIAIHEPSSTAPCAVPTINRGLCSPSTSTVSRTL